MAPGKRPRTLNLPRAPANTGPSVQRMPDPAAEAARREQTTRTAQWLDTAIRPDLHPPPVQQSAQRQTQSPSAPDTAAQLSGPASQDSGPLSPEHIPATGEAAREIDPPQPGIDKAGFIDNGDGANIRTGPAELGGMALTDQPIPPATRVFVSGQHPQTAAWWYVSAFLPSAIVRGYVQGFRVNTDLPEPSARLYQIRPGDTVERLAVQEFSAAIRDGHDLRFYENVLLAVNRDKNRAGILGTFQDPGLLGDGANNIQLEAGRRIWLVSPAYARTLEGQVPDGSLTNGGYAQVKRVLGHIDDLVRSVTDAPLYFGSVAGEYAAAIQAHLPEIVGITAGFILAESTSAFLAATPTGVGQLAALLIQLALAAFGAKFAIDACIGALKHGERWLTLAWTAHGDPGQLAEASKAFLHMLVSIAMAALTLAGVHGNMGKGLKIADAIHIQPPTMGMSPAMATANGGVMAGGPVFTPGSIATTGPVEIGISRMAGMGPGGSKVNPGEPSSTKPDAQPAAEELLDAATFEKYLSGLAPGDRVAAVRQMAEKVAAKNGWIKDSRLSKRNERPVYRDPKAKKLYALDTQHGRFEVVHPRSGKHQGEVDFALKPTKDADKSGNHDLYVK